MRLLDRQSRNLHTMNRKNIILFNPVIPQHSEPIVPLALLSISRYVYKRYRVKLIVSKPGTDVKDEIIEKCSNAICLGITCITGAQISEAIDITKSVKEKCPNLPIVWGGWHPTIMTKQTLESPFVDIVVRKQGEITFTELINTLNNRGDLSKIRGISYKDDGNIFHNPEKPFTNINEFPSVPYDLINLEEFIHSGSRYCHVNDFGERSIDYISSIGCPNNCQFCATPVAYKRRWFGKSPSLVIDELTFLKKQYGIDSIILRDDNVFVNKRRIVEICKALIESKLQLNIGFADGTADALSKYAEEDWYLLRKAGFRHIFIGVESGDQETLNLMRKNITPEQVMTVAKKCAEHDIAISFSFMVGTPLKNKGMKVAGVYKDIEGNMNLMRTIDRECKGNNFRFAQGFYMPFPGNDLYSLSKRCGFIEPDSLEVWANLSNRKIMLGQKSEKLERLVNFIHYVLRYKLNKNKLGKNNVKDYLRYFFQYIATLRFRYAFFLFPVDYWAFGWWSKRCKKRYKYFRK